MDGYAIRRYRETLSSFQQEVNLAREEAARIRDAITKLEDKKKR